MLAKVIRRVMPKSLFSMQSASGRKIAELRYRLHSYLGCYPKLIFPFYKLLGIYQERIVSKQTELVIEGFGRSASTYSYYAFRCAQNRAVTIATHMHIPAHVLKALQLKTPTLVIIREPKQAISSAKVREPYMPVKVLFERYRLFYQTLAPYQSSLVIADFKQVTTDFNSVISMVNNKFNKSFHPFIASEENNQLIEDSLSHHHQQIGSSTLTSYQPNSIKEQAKSELDFTGFEEQLMQCQKLYQRLTNGR